MNNEVTNSEERGATRFRGLLEEYCQDQGIKSNRELKELLQDEGYHIDVSTIGNYKNGKRKVPAEFIHHVGIALKLDESEKKALIEAYIADVRIEFIREFENVENPGVKRKKGNN